MSCRGSLISSSFSPHFGALDNFLYDTGRSFLFETLNSPVLLIPSIYTFNAFPPLSHIPIIFFRCLRPPRNGDVCTFHFSFFFFEHQSTDVYNDLVHERRVCKGF